MKIEDLKIKYPSGFEHAVHMTKEEIEQHIRLMAALLLDLTIVKEKVAA